MNGSDALRAAFQKVRRQYVGLPEEGADSVDAAIAEALNAAEEAVRAALDATNEPEPLDVAALADDVRYSGGNGTSDYWRGFNDGIDKLAARVSASVDREEKP